MARVKRGVTSHARHKKVLKLARGARGAQSRNIRAARQRVYKNEQYAYRDRRTRKRDFRRLWTQRINAGVRLYDMSYSQFIGGLHKLGIILDRKVISDMAIHQPEAFKNLVLKCKECMDKHNADARAKAEEKRRAMGNLSRTERLAKAS